MPRKAKAQVLDFDSYSEAEAPPDPFAYDPLADVAYQDKMEPDSKAELSAIKEAFTFGDRQRNFADIARERTRRNDSEYWVAVCFQSREQKDEFLRNAGLTADGDKYLDGQAVAAKLGIALTPAAAPPAGACKVDSKLRAIALPIQSTGKV